MIKIFSKRSLLALLCAILLPLSAFAQGTGGKSISGKVLDENGEPLIGAGVLSKDGKRGTVTDVNGKYSITLLNSDEVLIFSFIGYSSQEVKLAGRKIVDVRMVPDMTNTLNDVVVIGYGTTKKQDLTGSVANVKMSDIADVPVSSVDQALQGRIAGVDIMSTSGEPGSATSIRIRGTRSIEASNEPLIVVDGVMDAVQDLGDINGDDIESISVLKDASSTAIYGSRGANGVIIVTTKKGVTEKPTIRAKATFGVSWISKKLDVMNAEEFLRYRNDYYYFSHNQNAAYAAYKDPANFENDTDWIGAITRVAPYQNYQVTVSGNSKGNNYFGSLSYLDNQGVIINSGEKRVTGRFNFSKKVTDWFTFGVKVSTTYRKQDKNKALIGGTNVNNGAMYLNPLIGLMDDENPLIENGSLINTPYASATLEDYYTESWNNNAALELSFKPWKWLTIKSQNSLYTNHSHTYHFWPNTLPKRRPEEGADAYKYEHETVQLMTENTATYKKRFGRNHNFDAMVGFSASKQTRGNTAVTAKGLIMDEMKWNNLNGISSKDNYTVTSDYYEIIRESVYGRVNYNYKSKYYVTATVRGDGSSNFAANQKWGFFPSAALKWAMKREPWLKNVRWLSDLSLRASAGRTGNDAVSAYRSLQAYASTTTSYLFNGSQGVSYYPSRLANPDLTWEKTDQYTVALESSFFKNRLSVNFEAYYSNTRDLLLSVQTIQSTGYSSRFQNLGLTSNKGLELSIESHNIEHRNFGWTTTFTISTNKQMVEDIGDESYIAKINSPVSNMMMYGYKKGYPLNALWGLVNGGCCHNIEEAYENEITKDYVYYTTYSASNAVGMQRVVDQDHDGLLSMNDVVYLGQADPKCYGGLQNNFNIGRFKVGIYFAYSIGGEIYNYSELYMGGSYRTNQYRYMLNSWHPIRNPYSDIPRAGSNQVMLPSSNYIHDATYLRLKDLSVHYSFDLRKTKLKAIKDLTIGVAASNLFLWSYYNGFDPDVSTSSEDSTLRRVDMNSYPTSKKVVFNLSIRF